MKRKQLIIMTIAFTLSMSLLSGQSTGGAALDKPFIVEGNQVRLGGYFDHELRIDYDADGEITEISFVPHRLVPFIYAEIAPNLVFSTEIEFEYGGNVDHSGEMKVEFAALDYSLSEALNIRTGIILLPIGRFNLYHDSPVNDFTERPLNARYLIPTTLMESGAGIFGTIYPSENSVLGYELYLVNGLDEDPSSVGIRSARPDLKKDTNKAKSIVGRVNYSPMLGLDIGASLYSGSYDATADSLDEAKKASIMALDVIYTMGPLQFLGEFAKSSFDALSGDKLGGTGLYSQVNYHFGHGLVKNSPESVFTASLRYGSLEYDDGSKDNDRNRITVGLNFRPIERTAYKISYLMNKARSSDASEYTDAEASNQIRASVATYF